MITFDPHHVPVSVPGSLLTIGAAVQPQHRYRPPGVTYPERPGLFIRYISCFATVREVLRLLPLQHGEPVPFSAQAGPQGVDLQAATGGQVRLVPTLEGDGLAIILNGLGLRLERSDERAFDHVTPRDEQRLVLNSMAAGQTWLLHCRQGSMMVDAPWTRVRSARATIDLLPDSSGQGTADFVPWRHDHAEPAPLPNGENLTHDLSEAFARWCAPFPTGHPHWGRAVELAAWLLWSSQVGPAGPLRRRLTYQSQYKMTHFWTWDCCFNAVGLASIHPDRAWEELLGAFDHQAANGALPASFNDGSIHWNHAKPPVHGWALGCLREEGVLCRERACAILDPLARWSDWWFTHLGWSDTGIPVYTHGNDSGWDNASCFDVPPPWISPDLPALLALQLQEQARIADEIGDPRAAAWRSHAKALIAALIEHLWVGDRFVARRLDGSICPGDSLLAYIPIVLGEHLPQPQQQALIDRLGRENDFLTPHGLATEALASPYRVSDGYWRGSIWSPPVILIADGLRRAGAINMARRIAARFCVTCARAGFSENFDPETGAPLRDPTYTWTAGSMLGLLRLFPDLSPKDAHITC